MMDQTNQETPLEFISDVDGTATSQMNNPAKTVEEYLKDSRLINQLTERVYQLLIEDIQHQRERVNNYAPKRWM